MVDGSNASTFPQYGLAQAGLYPDPSQWSNPYTSFGGPGQIPGWPTQYAGVPMNAATGQPIAGYQAPQAAPPGTTLNSTPQAPVHGVGGLQPGQWDGANGLPMGTPTGDIQHATMPDGMPYGQTSLGRGVIGQSWQPQQPQPQQQQSQAPQSPAGGNSYQSALNALSNPGTPPVVGSSFTPQQATVGGGGNQGVLNNFIQNWQQGGIGQKAQPGLGGGSSGVSFGANNPFFAALGGQK